MIFIYQLCSENANTVHQRDYSFKHIYIYIIFYKINRTSTTIMNASSFIYMRYIPTYTRYKIYTTTVAYKYITMYICWQIAREDLRLYNIQSSVNTFALVCVRFCFVLLFLLFYFYFYFFFYAHCSAHIMLYWHGVHYMHNVRVYII